MTLRWAQEAAILPTMNPRRRDWNTRTQAVQLRRSDVGTSNDVVAEDSRKTMMVQNVGVWHGSEPFRGHSPQPGLSLPPSRLSNTALNSSSPRSNCAINRWRLRPVRLASERSSINRSVSLPKVSKWAACSEAAPHWRPIDSTLAFQLFAGSCCGSPDQLGDRGVDAVAKRQENGDRPAFGLSPHADCHA